MRTRAYVGLAAAIAAFAAGLGVWVASKDALRRTAPDGHHVWVPAATFAAAALVWALAHPGSRRAIRSLLGLVAGAATGAVGGLLIGSTKIHVDAAGDKILSGASVGRALIWAAIGAVAWAVTIAAATPRQRAGRAATGAALGGAGIGAAMGILAGTPLGSSDPVLTDAWFTGWYAFDPKIAHVAPVLALAVVVPLLFATYGAAVRRPAVPLTLAAAACLLLPALAVAIGHSTDIDAARRNGEPLSIDVGDGTAGGGSAASQVPDLPSVPAAPDASAPTLPPAPEATVATVPAAPVPVDTESVGTPDPTAPAVVTEETVATDIDPGFPVIIQHRFSGSNAVGEGFQGQMLIGGVFHNDAAPAAPDAGEVCALGPNDAVIPFYLQVAPYNANISEVRITMSQTVLGVADSATYPLTVQFNDLAGPRCAAATDPDIIATAAAVQWDTLSAGELGGTYGYIVVADYFDAAGQPAGAPSAVLAIAYELNHSPSTWSTQTYGTTTIDYDQGNGSAGTGFNLVPQ